MAAILAPPSHEAGITSQPLSFFCPTHQRPLQDFDHEGRRYFRPVCYDCLPAHRMECPRAQVIERFALVAPLDEIKLPELWCTCGNRRQMLALAPVPEYKPEEDKAREEALERELSEGHATADSWEGSDRFVLTIVAALWPLEFNWYFLLQENQRRHEAHLLHVEQCTRSICGNPLHLRPDCPPGHTWIEDWPSFTDEVITSIACHPDLSWAWEELACWRADVQFWLSRLPSWARELFELRKQGKSERDIQVITGWTRYTVRQRLKRLSWFVRHAADSKWGYAESTRRLSIGESGMENIKLAEPAAIGIAYAAELTEQRVHASITISPQGDSSPLPAVP